MSDHRSNIRAQAQAHGWERDRDPVTIYEAFDIFTRGSEVVCVNYTTSRTVSTATYQTRPGTGPEITVQGADKLRRARALFLQPQPERVSA